MSKLLETIKSIDGELQNIEYHQRRYEGDLVLKEYLKPPKKGLYRCRIVYDDKSFDVSYHKYSKRSISSLKLVYDDEISYEKKFADRASLDKLYLQRGECDDVLIVKNGLITDTTIANITFFKDGVWYTPATPLLKGTTRARLLDEEILKEADITPAELNKFTKVALLNAMIGFDIIPNIKIEGDDFVRKYSSR